MIINPVHLVKMLLLATGAGIMCAVREDGTSDMDIIWFLIIGLVAGWLAGVLVKGRGFGLLGDLLVGIVGALIGGFLFNAVGLATFNVVGRLIAATVGAVVLLFIIKIIHRHERGHG